MADPIPNDIPLVRHIEKSKRAAVLEIADRADAEEGIRQGLDDVKEDRLRPARAFFDEFETRHGR